MTANKDPIPEKGALLFLDGQMVLRYVEAGKVVIKPLSPASVRAAFTHVPTDSGWLPSPVRRWGQTAQGEYVILHFPARRYRLCLVNDFADRFPGRRQIEVEVPLPLLVFAGQRKTYYVWAMAGDEFRPEAEAFHAPLPNVQPDDSICFGDNHPPAASPAQAMRAWELFIASPFNSHLAGRKSRSFPDDVRVQLLRLADRRARQYPCKDMESTGSTLHQAVERTLLAKEH